MEIINQLLQIHRKCSGIAIDSRKVKEGDIFFALSGTQSNGNLYAESALKQGAIAAVIDDPAFTNLEGAILVDDALKTMQELANAYRKTLDIPIVALTGSNGKTTTKELIYAVLKQGYKTFATSGNFNNHIGVPISILSIPKDCELAIIEMGANHQGEIQFLSSIAEPTHGLITNIGKAHLEGFGGIEGVKKGKSELYRFLMERGGTLFVNSANTVLNDVYQGYKKVVLFGQEEIDSNTYLAVYGTVDGYAAIRVDDVLVSSHLVGEYNASNMHAAACIGSYFGLSIEVIANAIAAYEPDNNRSQLSHIAKNWYVMDAYNANPSSMSAAIKNFLAMEQNPKILVLGDMLELGDVAFEEHKRIIEEACLGNAKEIITVGPLFKEADIKNKTTQLEDAGAVREYILTRGFSNHYFLVKGSRRIGLEKIVADL